MTRKHEVIREYVIWKLMHGEPVYQKYLDYFDSEELAEVIKLSNKKVK